MTCAFLRRAILAASLVCVATSASGRQTTPSVSIVAPVDGAYVTGSLVLQARPSAGAAVREMTFYADGRSICTVIRPPFDCPWEAGTGIREHVIRVVATTLDGNRLVATVRTKSAGYTESVDVDVVQITATVTDGRGQFVKRLKREQFKLREDGVAQRLTSFVGENIPLELVVATDVSDSMTEAMPTLKASVKAFLNALRPTDQVTLIAFNDTIFTLARRSTDPVARLKAVDRLAPWGGTALYDAMLTGLNTVGKQPGRRALVVFTDGEDQNSASTIKRVESRLETSDATIYTIGLGRSVKDKALAGILQHLAEMSGGRAFLIDRAAQLSQVFGDIVEELSNQYLLSYASSNDKRDGTWRKISVDVTESGLHVRHRQGYRAPGKAKK
jgi:Ca-activated chloride channel family protein